MEFEILAKLMEVRVYRVWIYSSKKLTQIYFLLFKISYVEGGARGSWYIDYR